MLTDAPQQGAGMDVLKHWGQAIVCEYIHRAHDDIQVTVSEVVRLLGLAKAAKVDQRPEIARRLRELHENAHGDNVSKMDNRLVREAIAAEVARLHSMRDSNNIATIILCVRGARTIDWSDNPETKRLLAELNEMAWSAYDKMVPQDVDPCIGTGAAQ